MVVLEGEAGIGKSRLVAETLREASAVGLETLVGACSALSADFPFAPVADALGLDATPYDAERAAVQELLHVERPLTQTEGEHRMRVLHALVELIARSCDGAGTVLAVEDVHWADASTLQLLERLSRRSGHLPLLILLTMRPHPRPPPLESLLASLETLGRDHLLLGPLDAGEVRALVEASFDAEAGDGVLRAVRGAAGNPFFVGEVLATLEQEDILEVADGVVDAPQVLVAQSLTFASLRRLSFLPEPCMDVLRVAAMLGSEFDVRELSTVAAAPATELVPILDDAIASSVLREAGTRLAFRHDLVREAIYNDRPLAIGQALHHEAACRLRDADYPASKVAAHLLRGPPPADPSAILMLREVARECAYRDPSIAVELLERAAASLSIDDRAAVDVKAELAQALIWTGRWTEGHELAHEIAQTERHPDRSGQVLITLVQASGLRGALPASIVAEIDAAAHDPDLEPHRAVRLVTAAAQAAWLVGDLRRARVLATEAVAAAHEVADPVMRCEALSLLSSIGWHQGRAADGLDAAEQAVALARELSPDLGGDAQAPDLLLAMNLGLLGRYDEALPAFLMGMERAERANNVWGLGQLHQAFGVSQFYAGALDAAEGEFEAALGIWLDVGADEWATVQEAWLGRIAVHRGDVAAARRQLVSADALLPPGTDWRPARNIPVVSLTRALVRETEGDLAGAFAALEDARRSIVDSGAAYFNLRIGPEFVRLAVALGKQQAAAEMTAATEAVAETVGTPTARAQGLRCRGLLAGDAEALLEAVAAHREGPSRIELAGAAEEAAAALAATGAAKDAAALLGEALEIWEGAGATYDAGRVLARLRDGGAHPGKRGARRRAQAGWESLTDSEQRVLGLVREGITYREVGERMFISRRTVETHIARVFRKLGVGSRAELAALLSQQASEAG